jgi:hypothetical protein
MGHTLKLPSEWPPWEPQISQSDESILSRSRTARKPAGYRSNWFVIKTFLHSLLKFIPSLLHNEGADAALYHCNYKLPDRKERAHCRTRYTCLHSQNTVHVERITNKNCCIWYPSSGNNEENCTLRWKAI